jgi:formimidoylglutamate deiminase
MNAPQLIEADLTWTGEGFESGIRVAVSPEGRIGPIGPIEGTVTRRLAGQALLPGFVNAHSHAFQIGLRGTGERFPSGGGSFGTWLRGMYALAERISPAEFLDQCTRAFREMRASGITAVAEFHYLHHGVEGPDYAFDSLLIEAARAAGIRLVLLMAFHRPGGARRSRHEPQARFDTVAPDAFWTQMDALGQSLPPTVTLGVAAHSVRATSLEDLSEIHARSLRKGLPFQIHVEEHQEEIEDCLEAYGRTPMRVLLDTVGPAPNLTAVHCTHTLMSDRDALLAAGGRICLCPMTEGNLGDGLPNLDGVPHDRLCLGTDSNLRIDMIDEMRWLEYGQRIRLRQRGALRAHQGHVARTLFEIATAGGAAALGLDTGRMATGALADFVTIGLGDPELAGASPADLLDTVVYGCDGRTVTSTCVGGVWQEHREA